MSGESIKYGEETWWHSDEKNNALDYLETSVRSLIDVDRTPWAWKWVCIALHGAIYGFGICAIEGTNYSSVLKDTTAFIWEDIPGNDEEKLKKFLIDKFNKDLKDAKIERNGNVIKVYTDRDVILLEYINDTSKKYMADRYSITVNINGKKKNNLITEYRYSDEKLRILKRPCQLINFDEVINRCKKGRSVNSGIKPLVLDNNQKKALKYLKDEIRNKFVHFVPCSLMIEIHGLPEIAASCFEIIELLAGDSANLRWKDDELARIKALCNSGKELALRTQLKVDTKD